MINELRDFNEGDNGGASFESPFEAFEAAPLSRRPARQRRTVERLTFLNVPLTPLMERMFNESIAATGSSQSIFKNGDLPPKSSYEKYNQYTLGRLNWDSLLYACSTAH